MNIENFRIGLRIILGLDLKKKTRYMTTEGQKIYE